MGGVGQLRKCNTTYWVVWHPLREDRRVGVGPKWWYIRDVVVRRRRHSEGAREYHPQSWRRRGRSGVYAPRVPLVEARRQVLNVVVACRIGAVSGLLCLKVLFVVHLFVAEHDSAVGAVVGDRDG